jgi:hypothetical protein
MWLQEEFRWIALVYTYDIYPIFFKFSNKYFPPEPIRFLKPNVKQEIPYEFCNDGSADFVGAATVDVNPYPIHIVSGSHIDITANIDILKAIEAGSKIDLKLKLQGALFDIPIPCLEVRGHSNDS